MFGISSFIAKHEKNWHNLRGNAPGNFDKNEHPQTRKTILGIRNEHPNPKMILQPWADNTTFLRQYILYVYPRQTVYQFYGALY